MYLIKKILVSLSFVSLFVVLTAFSISTQRVYALSESSRFYEIFAATLDPDGQKLVDNINAIITTLSALTGIIIVGSVIYAGIMYSVSGGNPKAAAEAKKRISNAVFALLASVFIYAFLQWIVPGGIF